MTYRLSKQGQSLEPVIRSLKAWDDAHLDTAASG
ncbi:winged helix-turn-helix transcriptional regulator [Phyllobacterium endophyticum]